MVRQGARTSVTGAVVAGVALVLLQVLQQTVGAFNPRPVMSTLIVVAVFAATFVTKRLQEQRVEAAAAARLARLLEVSPPRPAQDCDRTALGVLPHRRALGGDGPYVPRTVDAEVRAATAPGAIVLLFGPALAGSSRTAYEAAAAALESAPVIAPRGPAALEELMALEPPFDLGGSTRIVWLDGLERYAEMLDATTLEELRMLGAPPPSKFARRRGRSRPRVAASVIATVRADNWGALLAATDTSGHGARAFAAEARAFEVSSALDTGENAAARRAYPDVDLEAGIGAALASTGRESAVPLAWQAGPADVASHARPSPDLQVLIPAALATTAVLAAALVWHQAGFSTPEPPTIADQLTAIKRGAARQGRRVFSPMKGTLDLTGTGEGSYVLYVRSQSNADPRSDEIRVYDRHGDRLREGLRFEPTGPRAQFSFRGATDVDGDGADEVVAGYSRPDARQAMVPFVLDWDESRNRYALVPLDLGRPRLANPKLARKFVIPARQYRPVYARAIAFRDRRGTVLRGRRVQDFVMLGGPLRVVAGYFLKPPLTSTDLLILQLRGGDLARNVGVPLVRPCTLRGLPVLTTSLRLSERSMTRAIDERWTAESRNRLCAQR